VLRASLMPTDRVALEVMGAAWEIVTQERPRRRQGLDHLRRWHTLSTGELYSDLGGE
jgi:hypothetical protein